MVKVGENQKPDSDQRYISESRQKSTTERRSIFASRTKRGSPFPNALGGGGATLLRSIRPVGSRLVRMIRHTYFLHDVYSSECI